MNIFAILCYISAPLPLFPYFLFLRSLIEPKIPNFPYTCLFTFFGNIITTGELMHTASKERMMPELMFSSERMPQVLITDSKVK